MPRHVPSIFQICIPQPAENRGLSFFSSKNPGSNVFAASRCRAPASLDKNLAHPRTSHCSSHVLNTVSRSMGARDGVENTTLVRARVPRGHQGLREEAPPRTPDAAHTCQKADDLLDLCRSGSSGLDLVSTHQRYGRSV